MVVAAAGAGKRKTRGEKKAKSSGGCPYKSLDGTRRVAETALAKVMDIEELVGEVAATTQAGDGACPYYGTREASAVAELVSAWREPEFESAHFCGGNAVTE